MKHSASVFALLIVAAAARADAFDDYNNFHLKKLAGSDGAKKVTKISHADLVTADKALAKIDLVFLIVHTADNRWAKLLVHAGGQKVDVDSSVPILVIDRFVTFKEGEERAFVAQGANLRLFRDFRFNLDIGSVVPDKIFPADLRWVDGNGAASLEPVGKAELFLVTKHLTEATPPKGTKIPAGAKFEPAFVGGDFKLYDDGKKPSDLHLEVGAKGAVSGWMFSGATGAKYEVQGQVGPNPAYGVQFSVALPRSAQTFTGWTFTAGATAIAGYSTLEGRESGFYAVRVE